MKNHFPDLSGAKVICFDVETKDPNIKARGAGWGRGDGHIIGVALATDDGFKQYYPIRHVGYENHNTHDVLDYCREQLGRPHQMKLGHNVIYDVGWLEHEGVQIKGDLHDTWTAAKLIDHGASASLEEQGQHYLKEGKISQELYDWQWRAFGQGKPKSDKALRENALGNLYRCPPALVGFYGESDVELPIRLARKQFEKLHELGLWEVYRMECDLIPILVQMRLAGVSVDLDAAEQARDQFLHTADEIQRQVDGIAGRHVNTGSPVEMEKIFSRLKIPFNRTANGKMSLTGEYLKCVEHPIGQLIVELEELKKYVSTFLENAILGSHVNGKIHGEFNPLRAVTGRMSASNPNLQQVPSRNELAKAIRSIFIPDAGHDHWRKVDYSSVESRILAHFAVGQNANKLRKQYNSDPFTDYHKFTIDMVKDVTGIEIVRKHAKIINFGLCIAEGQLVLTDRGLIPIEKISLAHRIWDGVEWVCHEGIIYKGLKEVITHDGLTATPDHKVWLSTGETTTLGEAQKYSRRLCRTQGEGGSPQHTWFDDLPGYSSEDGRGLLQGNDTVRSLWETGGEGLAEYGARTFFKVPVSVLPNQISGRTRSHVSGSLSVHDPEVPAGDSQLPPKLQGTWYQSAIRLVRTLCKMGTGKVAEVHVQEARVRQNRQQWTLLPGQSPVGDIVGKQAEHTAQRESPSRLRPQGEQPFAEVFDHHMLQHDHEGDDGRGDLESVREEQGSCGTEEWESKSFVRVYDILNAGPRRRFTCSGVLVSNCYGASEKKLASMLGISLEEASPLFEAFHSGLPYVKATMSGASEFVEENGYSRTILGRRTNFDYWEPKYSPKGTPRAIPLKFESAIRAYGPNIRRAHLHKAVNAIIQGSAADLMKSAMVKCHKAGLFDSVGFPRLVVHDELDWSIREDVDEEAFKEILWTMENAIKFKVPIKVEGEWGPNWSNLHKLDV